MGGSGGEDSPMMTQKPTNHARSIFKPTGVCNTPFGAVTFKCAFRRKQTEPGKQAKKEKYLQPSLPGLQRHNETWIMTPQCREVVRNKRRVEGMIPTEINWQRMKAATNLGSVPSKLTPAFIH